MSAQRVATGVGLAALAALLISVGLPPLLPPSPVAEIEIVAPAGEQDESADPVPTIPLGRPDSPADSPADDTDPDGSPEEPDDDADDSPDDADDDSPDDDGEDDDD